MGSEAKPEVDAGGTLFATDYKLSVMFVGRGYAIV